jgi:hypothetical protein
MGIRPSFPGVQVLGADVASEGVASEGNGKKGFKAGEAHETDVSASVEAAVTAREEFVELLATLVECADGEDGVDSRDEANQDGPEGDKDDRNGSIIGPREATKVFINVEAMTLRNILQNHLQQGNAKADSEVNHNSTAFLCLGDCDGLDACNMVKTAIDAEGSCRDCDGKADNEFCTDIAPDWCPVNGVTVPDDGVDEKDKASQASPGHVKTCPSVPGFQMPREWDTAEQKPNEGEHREDPVGRSVGHGGLGRKLAGLLEDLGMRL